MKRTRSTTAHSLPRQHRPRAWRATVVLISLAWLACSAEPPPAARPVAATPPRPASSSEAAPPPPWSPPICRGGAIGIRSTWEDIRKPLLHPNRWELVDHAVTDDEGGAALHVFGADAPADRKDPMAWATVHAELTVWDARGSKRWSKRLGPYDPYGEGGFSPIASRLALTETSVVVAIGARGRIAIDGGDPMFAIEEPGTRGVVHLQLASFSLATGEREWSRAIEALPPFTMWMREGGLEIHADGRTLRIAAEGRGAISDEALPHELLQHLAEGTGTGPDGQLWLRTDQKPLSGERRAGRDPRWLVTATSRPGQLHVCKVPCHEDAELCGWNGGCTEVNGQCVATEESCRTHDRCRIHGFCSLDDDGSCVALTDAECEASVACQEEKRCAAADGFCAKRCPDGVVAFDCERTSCEDSYCRDFGGCAFVNGTCSPGSDAHCRASRACTDHGRCALFTHFSPTCSATNVNDCLQSTACRERGECSLFKDDAGQGLCAVSTPADCQRSAICREEGRCSPVKFYRSDFLHCDRASDADCRRSQACKRDGRCRLVSGECVP